MKPGTTEKILQTRAAQGQRGREQDDGIDHGVRAPLTPKTRQDHAIHRTCIVTQGKLISQALTPKVKHRLDLDRLGGNAQSLNGKMRNKTRVRYG